MSQTSLPIAEIVRFCPEIRPYPMFDEQGHEILPCGKSRCETPEGEPFYPRTIPCANASCHCEGGKIRFLCPAVIFCSPESFQATLTQEAWDAAGSEMSQKIPGNNSVRRKKVKKENKFRQNRKSYARRLMRRFLQRLRQNPCYATSFLPEAFSRVENPTEIPDEYSLRNPRRVRKKST